jgi:Helix-turn-helix domain
MPSLEEMRSWYTTELAAEALGRSRQGAINLALDGKIRAVKIASAYPNAKGCWVFSPESIAKFLEAEREEQQRQAEAERERQGDGA